MCCWCSAARCAFGDGVSVPSQKFSTEVTHSVVTDRVFPRTGAAGQLLLVFATLLALFACSNDHCDYLLC